MNLPPNAEQAVAIAGLVDHVNGLDDPFQVLKGPAGTGKTFVVRKVIEATDARFALTAPTNKAVRVIRDSLADMPYKPPTLTIYSLLGLQMIPNGEVKVIGKGRDTVDLSEVDSVVIDEAFMLNKHVEGHIQRAAEQYPHVRWILPGDEYQLPPVGEKESVVLTYPKILTLSRVMRTDNQILTMATHIRHLIDHPGEKLIIANDNDGKEGVWAGTTRDLTQAIIADTEGFRTGASKAIAWRNATVDSLNTIVRRAIHGELPDQAWLEGERVTLLEPAKDLNDEIVGTTDEEGTILHVDEVYHPLYREFQCYRLVVQWDSELAATLFVLKEDQQPRYESFKAKLAAAAKATPREWRYFWAFVESFHKVRHGWATTAHRAQGSTYINTFVNWRDILVNRNYDEALRCLYVAASRGKVRMHMG